MRILDVLVALYADSSGLGDLYADSCDFLGLCVVWRRRMAAAASTKWSLAPRIPAFSKKRTAERIRVSCDFASVVRKN